MLYLECVSLTADSWMPNVALDSLAVVILRSTLSCQQSRTQAGTDNGVTAS